MTKRNIAGCCQQTFKHKKVVDITAQQCFAFTPQGNFPAHNLIFQLGEGDEIVSRLPFKIFSTLVKTGKIELTIEIKL